MRIRVENPNGEWAKRIKGYIPGHIPVKVVEVIEIHVYWWQWDWYQFQWWRFNIWFCELLVPELKKEPKNITFY